MKKLLIITYYWPPSGGAGVQRWVKFTKYLSRLGHEPIVLTVDPEFATYPQVDESLLKDIPEQVKVYHCKSFELYSLYKRISTDKEVPYGGFVNTKKLDFKEKTLRFIRGNFFIPDPRKGWNKYAIEKAKEIIREHNIETVITTSPPHSSQLIGLKLKKQLGIKWIADLRDPWTDIYYFKNLYPTRIVINLHKRLERRVLKESDYLITVSPSLKRLFHSKIKNIEQNISVIPNGFDTDDFPQEKQEYSNKHFLISYIGTLSKDYTIDAFIKSLVALPDYVKACIQVRFIGKISDDHIQKFKQTKLWEKVKIITYVEHKKAVEYMYTSDVLLLIIPDINNNKGILTGKLFEYLACNRPILFLGPTDGDAAKIIKETQSGFVHLYNDTIGIKESLIFLHSQKKKQIEQLNNPKILSYSRENLTKELIKLL